MKHYLTRRDNGIWYVLSKEGAKRVAFVSTKTKSKHEAQEFLKAYVPGKESENVPILSGLKSVLDEKLTKVLAKKTIESYKGELRELVRLIGDKSLDELTQADADKWSQEAKTRFAATTYNTGLRSLRAIFNRCKKWYPEIAKQCGAFDNLELLRLPDKEALFLTEELFKKFLEAEEAVFYKHLFAFAFFTGMRKGEIRNCKWEHIDFDKNQIAILNTEDFQTKSKRNRHIPIAKSLKPILLEMQKERDNGYLFSRHEGKRLSDGNVSFAFHRTLGKTKLDQRLTFHSLRHSFAAALLERGADTYTVAKLLGHNSVRMVEQIYGHVSDAHKQKVMEDFNKPKQNIVREPKRGKKHRPRRKK